MTSATDQSLLVVPLGLPARTKRHERDAVKRTNVRRAVSAVRNLPRSMTSWCPHVDACADESKQGKNMSDLYYTPTPRPHSFWQTFDMATEAVVTALVTKVEEAVENSDERAVEEATGLDREIVRFSDFPPCERCGMPHELIAIECTSPELLIGYVRYAVAKAAYWKIDNGG